MARDEKRPAVRFAGFTDPWEQRKLGELSEPLSYGMNAASTDFDGINKYIRITDIDDETRMFNMDGLTSPVFQSNDSDKYKLDKGDLLFARTGASVGKTYIYKSSDGLVYFAGFLIRARIKPDYVADFVFQNTLTERYKQFIQITSQRSGQPGVNAQEYESFSFFVPKKEEQRMIGNFFSQFDNLITLHQRKYDKLVSVKKSMLEKMFPKNGSNKPEIRFSGFTDPWEQRKLEDAVDVRSGQDYKHLSIGDIPVYGTGGYMLSVDKALSYSEDAIGIGRKGTIDKPYLLRAPFWTVDTLFFTVPRYGYSLEFTHSVFQRINWKRKDESTGVPSLSKTTINDIDILVPKLVEQKRIGAFFAKIDNLITLHQRKLEKLKNIKKSMLEKMFV